MRVLIVEDDPHLSRALREGFRNLYFDVASATTYAEGRERALLSTYDAIVLDIMLPGGSGLDLCRLLRDRGVKTPIVILTARDGVDDRVHGLEVGADDYVTKPFSFRELAARIRALIRRPPVVESRKVEVADLTVDLRTRKVRRAGRDIELTAKEFALLEVFAGHVGEVVDRSVITAHVWDENHDPFTNVLEVLVRRLRRKLDDQFEPKLIHTLRGAGYRFGPLPLP